MPILFFMFIVMPIIEMWLLIEVGSRIGALSTILLVLLTAMIGAWMLRQQGLSTMFRFNQRLEQGELPATEIFEGLLLAVGGALLLTPGFVTDAIGFACLLPFTRQALVNSLIRRGVVNMSSRQGHYQRHETKRKVHTDRDGHTVIDGEYRRDD